MNWEAIGAIGEVLGAVGVVATLGYLAFQLRQNNKLLSAQARYSLRVLRSDVADSILAAHVLEAIHKYAAGEDVTPAEKSAAFLVALKCIELWEWQHGEYRAGALQLEELPLEAWRIWYRGEAQVPIPVKEVWEARRPTLPPDFVEFMEQNVINER
jgi:hypothetical protein